MKSLAIGFGIAIVGLLIAAATRNWKYDIDISLVFGVVLWGLAGIFSGVFLSGDRMRANYFMEDSEGRQRRFRWATNCFLVGLPSILSALIVFFSIR
ncbi:DUF5316 domain-containing protein [Fodinisporobacter ferrooxydans]|uniref:DUF5316 domain-containing protein n=1 Tax=Fodinisporobacter ferrooxydans TaxID=2901836 RepID=A0ABY4CHY2_9BACL|nr:DUF5316 domain-containing protein [Alicyclobacillaceae bacterium MYW30-H2]